jgi:Cu(I)/Ag(I) efflux system protein CusF
MDTFSHGLWGAAAALGWARLGHVSRAQVAGAALLGLAPDLAQAVPVAGWALTQADPIAALGWPAMTMNFKATPEQIASVQAGQAIEFDFLAEGMQGTITAIRSSDAGR